MNKNNYTTYHLHSDFSLLDSCTKYQDYVDKAVELGQTAIAFSEHGNIYNWTDKKRYCDKKGIKYIHACEIYLTEMLYHTNESGEKYKIRDNYHTMLLAKNLDGVKELNALISLANDKDHFYFKPRISFEEFLNISDNIITTSACLASPLFLRNFERNGTKLVEMASKIQEEAVNVSEDDSNLDDIMSDIKARLIPVEKEIKQHNAVYEKLCQKYTYYEIQPHINSEEQKTFNKYLWELSQKYRKPLIAGTDTHSINKYKSECRSILQKSKKIEFTNEDDYDLTYKSYDELVSMFKEQDALPAEVYMQAIENTNVMADSIEHFELDTSIKYPLMYKNDEEVFIERIYSMLQDKISQGIITTDQIDSFNSNIEEEIRVFKKVNMCGFMLSMSEIVCWARENGIPFGNARGSVGGSYVAYVTDIIDLNPETWKTVFSRFCNEDRVEVGDIDIDCFKEDRQKVFDYIITRFTQEKTAYVLAMSTISDKGTIDCIGRALGMPLDEVKQIKKEYDINPEILKVKYPKVAYYFDGMVGTYIAQSRHPAGIIASPIPLSDNYGTLYSKSKEDGIDLITIQLDMECVHEVGLVKYDILGLKNVGIIKKTCEYIGIPYPKSHEINWKDEEVWEDMKTSNIGIFQFESAFAFQMLKRFDTKSIEDMSLVTAMIRPSGESYREDLVKKIPHKNPSEIIDELLQDNYGYLVYQEDTIKFLKNICGLSGSQADNLRRGIGRKDLERVQQALPGVLEGYCNKSNQPREIAEEEAKEFLKIIEDSASYQFGYNHSVAYCMIGYLCAYFRHYYPYEFLTAFLNCSETEEDFASGTELINLKGLKIKEPKFRHSKAEYFFNKDTKTIYKGMKSIKFLNNAASNGLYGLRNNQYETFIDLLFDIYSNVSINSRQLDILIKLDFFEEFGRPKNLLRVYKLFSDFKEGAAKSFSKEKFANDRLLTSIIERNSVPTEKTYTKLNTKQILKEAEEFIMNRKIEDYSYKEVMAMQKEYLGYINLYTGKEEDRAKLIILSTFMMISKFGQNQGKPWAVMIKTQSIGSNKKASFTIPIAKYNKLPVNENDIIYCKKYSKNKKGYFYLDDYEFVI